MSGTLGKKIGLMVESAKDDEEHLIAFRRSYGLDSPNSYGETLEIEGRT